MKKLLYLSLLALLPSYFSFGQNIKKDKESVEAFFWGKDDFIDEPFVVPEKWKNESEIIVYQNINYFYGKKFNETSSIRERIYLNDQAAVERHSTKELEDLSILSINQAFEGIKIIKPDGSEKIINLKKESKEEDGKLKLAIANLEIGDIIDYYYISFDNGLPAIVLAKSSYPMERTLAQEYPIKEFRLRIDLDLKKCYLNFNSFNGAPNLEKIEPSSKKTHSYELYATDVNKQKDNFWNYPLLTLPTYKMEIVYLKSGIHKNKAYAFSSNETTEVKTKASKFDVGNLYDNIYPTYFPRMAMNLRKNLKKYLSQHEYQNEFEKAEAAYYFLRFYTTTRPLLESIHHDYRSLVKKNKIPYYNALIQDTYGNDIRFIQLFISYLEDEQISYNILASKRRYDGRLDDLIIARNLKHLLSLRLDGEDYIIDNFGFKTNFTSINPLVESTEAYSIHPHTKSKNISLPKSSGEENISKSKVSLELNNMESIDVVMNTKTFGHQKSFYQNKLMTPLDLMDEEFDRFIGIFNPEAKTVTSKKFIRQSTTIEGEIANFLKERDEKLKKYLEEDLEVTLAEGDSFEVIQTGRFSKDDPFEFQHSFTLENQWIKKAGPNYLIEIGKAMSAQRSIKEEDRERDIDIDMSFARSFENEIELLIPEGYEAVGIDKLNKSVANETGSFESKAHIEGNKLILKTKKVYAKHHIEKENWDKMLEFIDLAFELYQAKVMLKKI